MCKRVRDDETLRDAKIIMDRRFRRSDTWKAIKARLPELSKAAMLETFFPGLQEVIREEWVIGERLFECPDLTVQQVHHYQMANRIRYWSYAAKSNRPELFELVPHNVRDMYVASLLKSKNTGMFSFIDPPIACGDLEVECLLECEDDPERIRLAPFKYIVGSMVYHTAVSMGAWKTAAYYADDGYFHDPRKYLLGAYRRCDFGAIDEYLADAQLVPNASHDFKVHMYVKDRIQLHFAATLAAAKTKEDAYQFAELFTNGYFNRHANELYDWGSISSVEVLDVMISKKIVTNTEGRKLWYTNMFECAKILFARGWLSASETIYMATCKRDYEFIKWMISQNILFDPHFMMDAAFEVQSMKCLRIARSMGAIPTTVDCEIAISNENRYMFRWLYRRLKHNAARSHVLGFLLSFRKEWKEEACELKSLIVLQ